MPRSLLIVYNSPSAKTTAESISITSVASVTAIASITAAATAAVVGHVRFFVRFDRAVGCLKYGCLWAGGARPVEKKVIRL